MRHFVLFLSASLVLPLAAYPTWAHALRAEYKVLANKVEIRAEFDDETAAQQAKVRVHDADKNLIANGETDAKGLWSFPKPTSPGTYQVLVDAGAGHLADVTFRIGDAAPTTGTNLPLETAASRTMKIAIGVGVIAVLGLALWAASRQQRKKNGKG